MKTRDSGMPPLEDWSAFFDAPSVLETLGLHRAEGPVVDVGAGYGTFTLPVARLTGHRVLAIDIDPDVLGALIREAAEQGIENVTPLLRDVTEQSTGLPDDSADVVLLFNILHCENPLGLLEEARRILRPSGRVGILHWRSDVPTPRGPSLPIRPRPEQCASWLEDTGFLLLVPPVVLPPYHYGMVGRKPEKPRA